MRVFAIAPPFPQPVTIVIHYVLRFSFIKDLLLSTDPPRLKARTKQVINPGRSELFPSPLVHSICLQTTWIAERTNLSDIHHIVILIVGE